MSSQVRCVVVDDEPLAVSLLVSYIDISPQLSLVGSATNAIDALQLLKQQEVDLLFLDIQMPLLTGLELIRSLQDPPSVIFTTAYRDYAVDSYELDAVDYLMKPITMVRFLKAVDKYYAITKEKESQLEVSRVVDESVNDISIYVNVNKRYVKVVYSKITYIESVKDYIHIHTAEDTIITKEKISEFGDKLPPSFIRIHRSFIVNRAKITAFTNQDIEIGPKELPIGASYKEAVLKALR